MVGEKARFAAALQWVREAAGPALDADRRGALLESARAIAGAEMLIVGAPAEVPSPRGRWFRARLARDVVIAALPRAPFTEWQREFLLLVGEALLRADRAARATLRDRLDAVEREALLRALRRTGGNRSHAARLLGITRGGLYLKMRRHGIA